MSASVSTSLHACLAEVVFISDVCLPVAAQVPPRAILLILFLEQAFFFCFSTGHLLHVSECQLARSLC